MLLKHITYQSSKIFYRVIGKGDPVLLVHGFGESGTMWRYQVEFLQDQYTLIVPDLPGSGSSEMIGDMSIEGMAGAIKSVLAAELSSQKKAIVFGHSMGGYITLALTEKYPQFVKTFGLVHSTAFADSEEKKLARLRSIEFIKKNSAFEFIQTSSPGLFTKGWASQNQQQIDALIHEGKNFTADALVAYYQAMIDRPERTNLLKGFTAPILFIIGVQDMAIPFEQGLQQSYLPVQSHIKILRNSAHMGMWEETKAVNLALAAFLSRVAPVTFV